MKERELKRREGGRGTNRGWKKMVEGKRRRHNQKRKKRRERNNETKKMWRKIGWRRGR